MNKIIIEKEKLEFNINAIKDQAKIGKISGEDQIEPRIIAVLKANAYGIGTELMSKVLIENGVDFFAVTDVSEAVKLRKYASDKKILVLNSTCIEDEVKQIVDNNLIASCGSFESIDILEKMSKKLNKKSAFHLNIDTGMSRFGFRADELLKAPLDISDEEKNELLLNKLTKKIKELEFAKIEGIYTHFQESYAKDAARTKEQFSEFVNVMNKFKEKEVDVGLKHCCNTSAFFKFPYMHLDAVRVGSAFSGRAQLEIAKKLKRVGYLESDICEIRQLKAGDRVFYSGMFTAKNDMKVGVVQAGYADGFELSGPQDNFRAIHKLRQMKNAFISLFKDTNNYVEINGKKKKVLGRIGMKNFVVDLTDVDANVGDKVKISIPLSLTNNLVERELI